MGGYIKNGAQAVYIDGAGTNLFSNTQTGTLNTSALFQPVGAHLSDATISSATTLTPPSDTNAIMIGIEDQSVRIRMDGTDADASTGFLFAAGDVITIQFTAGTSFSVIETAATATIQYQWGKI